MPANYESKIDAMQPLNCILRFDDAPHARPKINLLRDQNDVPNKNKNQIKLKQILIHG